MFVVGEFLKRRIIRKWNYLHLNSKTLVFPELCPVCLATDADRTIEEQSGASGIASYVFARKWEWWKASVPYCSRCTDKLLQGRLVGWILGGVCALMAFLLAPPLRVSLGAACYILFGYPAYTVATTTRKGVVLDSASDTTTFVRVKHPEYFQRLAALNRLPSAIDTPLAS